MAVTVRKNAYVQNCKNKLDLIGLFYFLVSLILNNKYTKLGEVGDYLFFQIFLYVFTSH